MHGTNEISKTSFRVPSDAAIDYWAKRFDRLNVTHTGIKEQFGKKTISFVDFDDQQYQLISDENNQELPQVYLGKRSSPVRIRYYRVRSNFCKNC